MRFMIFTIFIFCANPRTATAGTTGQATGTLAMRARIAASRTSHLDGWNRRFGSIGLCSGWISLTDENHGS